MSKAPLQTNFIQKLNTNYRIVFINDESLQEVASYKLTMRKLYVLFSSIFVVIVTLTICLLLLTPLKYYIPGYGNNQTHVQVIKLKRRIDSLSDLVAAQQMYEANMRKVIGGDYNGQPDTTMLDKSQIRKEAMNNIFPVQPTPSTQQADAGSTESKPAHIRRRHRRR